jgi:prevent-host-death family protein
MNVGVRELKAHLSEYVERAASGERIVVTHRGRVKAELGPPSLEARLAQAVREGRVRPGRGRIRAEPLRLKGRMTVAEAMAEDREE